MEIMTMHKLNVLHLHLVDDPGWRVQIDKYPELTEKGGTMNENRSFKYVEYLSLPRMAALAEVVWTRPTF